MVMNEQERELIREAAEYMENPGALIRVLNVLGQPVERLAERLPAKTSAAIRNTTRAALEGALTLAIRSLNPGLPASASFSRMNANAARRGRWHMVATAATGAAGGAFGLLSLPFELPLTTTLMLRSIARIAAEYGADLSSPEGRLECLYIFTLGTPSPQDDAAETSYYASRIGFAQLLRQAAAYLADRAATESLFALTRSTALTALLRAVSGNFERAVLQKFVAGAVPLVGAAGGGRSTRPSPDISIVPPAIISVCADSKRSTGGRRSRRFMRRARTCSARSEAHFSQALQP